MYTLVKNSENGLQPYYETDREFGGTDGAILLMMDISLAELNEDRHGVSEDTYNELNRLMIFGSVKECIDFWSAHPEVNVKELHLILTQEFLAGQKLLF